MLPICFFLFDNKSEKKNRFTFDKYNHHEMFVRYLLTVPVTKNLNGFLKNNSDCYWKKRNGENVPNILLQCLFSLPVEIYIIITCARSHVTSINGKVKKSDIFIRRLGGQQLMPKVLYSVYDLLSYKVTII